MCLGIPGEVVEIVDAERKVALVDVSGVRREVNIACVVDDAQPVESLKGEWVLVHVGFAMSRIDPEEAQRTLALLEELGEVEEELAIMRATARETGGDSGMSATTAVKEENNV